MAKKKSSLLSADQSAAFLQLLQQRFEKNMHRHKNLKWEKIIAKLKNQPETLWSLYRMEDTGGEPDVVQYDKSTDSYLFFDCAEETPKGRRSLCYDPQALASRKQHKPKGSALGLAAEMGISILNEEQYSYLQKLEPIDLKTSSWIATPSAIRDLGGALFCDRRYNHVFVYHNGAESYYGVRGFRGSIKLQ